MLANSMLVLDVEGVFYEVEALALQYGLHAVVDKDPLDHGGVNMLVVIFGGRLLMVRAA